MSKRILHIKHIENDLNDVQKNWKSINESLYIQRDEFSDEVKDNLLLCYDYVNYILKEMDGESIFESKHIDKMLEMNHLILLGDSKQNRNEYSKHIKHTREKFYSQISSIKKKVKKSKDKGLYKQEAGVFVAGVSQPQLFVEGNHRTHSTIVNIMALQGGKIPFILNTENAKAFFDPAQEVKGTHKKSYSEKLKLLRKKKFFEIFFKQHASDRYIKNM